MNAVRRIGEVPGTGTSVEVEIARGEAGAAEILGRAVMTINPFGLCPRKSKADKGRFLR